MSSLLKLKSTHIDRDDFDADHYADFIRDSHRSRITLDQLDIAQRQHRRKEKLLSRVHHLKMKEYTRVKNEFIRKIEQDTRISNLPNVKEKLKAQRRQHSTPSPPPISNDQSQEITMSTKHDEKSHQLDNHPKSSTRPDSPRTGRLKVNLNKFKHMDSLLS
ncbi:unnamed protein product [Rotaria sp. Silwood2]|nr:unnamed protein product [Rotaria sp. Silwood2]CAF2468230.1 unnamed protein product [Rotaria sp. Silwood2]CAF2704031.1 unnamed protein product [Rotaria sp. Silwood2]CAF2856642.1 unnamed protein product [Rotaria sp. Silwood2]CAF3858257.1 unnamed protein product [Rotaria sp. Silwood2]